METKAFKLKDRDDIEVYSVFERNLDTVGTVNVNPNDVEETKEAIEEMGYVPAGYEDLRDFDDGEPFTRIEFRRSDE